ncbi:MAG: hypothetical protein C0483_14115 [Pirellula sp.]|nr:hypothetical protein [Pirellula sp.]
MLRSNNTNEITFKMNLEVDPRYRQNLATISKAVVQEQEKMLKSTTDVESRRTSIVVGEERKRATTRRNEIDKTIADMERMFAKQDQLERRMAANRRAATHERVIGNVLASAGVRADANDTRANFYRNQQANEAAQRARIAGYQRAADEARIRSEEIYRREVELTGATVERQSAKAIVGIKQTTAGLMAAARAAGALGVAFGADMEGAVRTLAAIEGGVQGVTAVMNTAQGMRTLMGAGAAGRAGLAIAGAGTLGAVAIGGGALLGRYMNPGGEGMYERDRRMGLERIDRDNEGIRNRGIYQTSVHDSRLRAINRSTMFTDLYGDAEPFGKTDRGAEAHLALGEVNAIHNESLAGFRRASRGRGMERLGQVDIEVDRSPSAALAEQARFAGQLVESARQQEVYGRRLLDDTRARRDIALDTNRQVIDGMMRITELGRDQLHNERAKLELTRGRAVDSFAAFGRSSKGEQARVNSLLQKRDRGEELSRSEREFLTRFGGDIAEIGRKGDVEAGRRDAKGTAFEAALKKIEASQATSVDVAERLAKTLAETTEKQRVELQKKVGEAFKDQFIKVADVIVAAIKDQEEFGAIVKQREAAGRAMERQAQK